VNEPGLKRDVGLMGAVFVALNGIVGAGIFALPQELAAGTGPASPYVVLALGALVLFVAIVFAELAAQFDRPGGMVVYANAAFGNFAGFQAGLLYYIARIAAMGANTNVLLTYAATFAPGVDHGAPRLGVIAALWFFFTAINVFGVKGAVRTLNVVTIAKLAPLAALVTWGLVAFAGTIPAPQAPSDRGAIGGIALLTLYAFLGFEQTTTLAGEMRDAKKTLPRVLVGAVAATTVFYFLIQLAYVAIVQGRVPDGAPLAAAAQMLAGQGGAAAIAGIAIVSIAGNMFSASIVVPRVTLAMAEEKSLPAWFAAVHPRFATPVNSILSFGILVAALAISGAFVWLAIISSLARIIVYVICVAALLKVRRDAPAQPRALAQTLVRWFAPALAAAFCLWAIAQAKPDAWLFLAVFTAAGGALYALTRRRRAAKPA
jgi:amino acid transporter